MESSVPHAFPALETRKLESQGPQHRLGTTNRDHQWAPNCLPMELSILINRSSLPIQWSQMFVTFPLVKRGTTSVTNRRDIGIQPNIGQKSQLTRSAGSTTDVNCPRISWNTPLHALSRFPGFQSQTLSTVRPRAKNSQI